MIKKILLFLAVALLVLLAVIATRPADFRVSRSATVAAKPDAVFPYVNDLGHWDAWSPWAQMDPNQKVTFEGPKGGKGAIFKWSGNNEVGEGSQEIVESVAPERVAMKLHFIRPFEDTANVEFTLTPEGDGTRVTWTMSGKNKFIGKAISLFMDCDAMVGPMFEQGLSKLAEVAKAAPQK